MRSMAGRRVTSGRLPVRLVAVLSHRTLVAGLAFAVWFIAWGAGCAFDNRDFKSGPPTFSGDAAGGSGGQMTEGASASGSPGLAGTAASPSEGMQGGAPLSGLSGGGA